VILPSLSRLLLAAGLALASAVSARAQTVAEVQVTPETLTLAVGGKQRLFATAYDRQGNLIPNARFTFWSSDTNVAKVGRDGAVLGVGPGLAKVEARVQGLQASTAILITGSGAGDTAGSGGGQGKAILTLEPTSATLLPGESLRIEARPVREDGSPVVVGRVSWKPLHPEVAAVDSNGMVIGVGPGRTIVQATAAGGLTATTAVEVAAAEIALAETRLVLGPGETDTLRVLVPGQGNRELRAGLQWQTSDTGVVRVGPTGLVSARVPGRAEVVATGFGQERRASVLVHREPRTLVVTPRPAAGAIQLPARAVRKVTVVAEAADSTPIPEARSQWEVGDTTVIAYDTTKGELHGRGLGTTTLTARLYGFDPVVWTVQVIPGVLSLDRRRIGIGIGERDSLRPLLLDENGKPQGAPSELTWSGSAPRVLQVSGAGVIDGLRPGRATVTAAAPWGKSATADVFVVADLFLSSNRGGNPGIYQLRSGVADTLRAVLADSFANIQPALAPDRTRIAFSSNRAGSYDLYLMDADGENLQRLTTDPGREAEPVWTPDGTRLVYTVTRQGAQPQLYYLRPDGRPAQALTAEPGGNHSPAISIDGRSLAFVSTRDGNQEIYLMAAEGGTPRRVTRSGQRESQPHFLPNGDLIYVVERGKGSRLVRLAGTEGEPQTVLETEEPISGLAVSRDGRRLAYVVGRLTEAGKSKAQFRLFVRSLAAEATPAQVTLRPGEHVLSPAF
jgi:WD40-like Beta Propeller Repeat/Bacterial Ig-like domain (group 2)